MIILKTKQTDGAETDRHRNEKIRRQGWSVS